MTFCLILPLCITTKTFQNRQLGCNRPARFQFKFNKNPNLTVWESQPDSIWCRNILQNLPRNNLHHYSNERHQIKTLFSLKNMHFSIHNTHNNSLRMIPLRDLSDGAKYINTMLIIAYEV